MARQCNPVKERRWLDLVRLWQQSGLSVRAFCARRRIGEPNFYVWRRVLRQRGLLDDVPATEARRAPSTPPFVRIAVDADAGALPTIDLILTEGRMLRIGPGFDRDLLRQLLRVLEEPSC